MSKCKSCGHNLKDLKFARERMETLALILDGEFIQDLDLNSLIVEELSSLKFVKTHTESDFNGTDCDNTDHITMMLDIKKIKEIED